MGGLAEPAARPRPRARRRAEPRTRKAARARRADRPGQRARHPRAADALPLPALGQRDRGRRARRAREGARVPSPRRRLRAGQRMGGLLLVPAWALPRRPGVRPARRRLRARQRAQPPAVAAVGDRARGGAADQDRAGDLGAARALDHALRAVDQRRRCADERALHALGRVRARAAGRAGGDRVSGPLGPGLVASQLHRRRAAPDCDEHPGDPGAARGPLVGLRRRAQSPTVFVTEGGARLSRMPALYPAEDPRQAQAKCLRDAWALHQRDSGAGAGVAMFAQYLLYADPNFDCGLLDPYPSTVKRPAYAAWKAFPRTRSGGQAELEALAAFAPAPLLAAA